MATNIQLVVTNVPSAAKVDHVLGGRVISYDSGSASDPTAANQVIALTADSTDATKWTGNVDIADPLAGSTGIISVRIESAVGDVAGASATNATHDARARFTTPSTDFVITFDFLTGRWTGDDLLDSEVEVSVVNELPEHRFVTVEDRGVSLATAVVAGGATEKMYYRPFGSLSHPTLQHAANPDNASNGDQKYLPAPLTGPATVHLNVAEGEGKQIRQIHDMLIALLVVACVVAFVYLSMHVYNGVRGAMRGGRADGRYDL